MQTPEVRAGLLSRRRFFQWTSSLAATVGLAPAMSSARALAEPTLPEGEDYYDKLGVTKIINAAGTYTMFTAACMPPSVLAAVQKAALHPVRLHDLQQKSGEYIAKKLQCEGAIVTSGASGAISLATAACMQHANNISPLAMPQAIDGMKNQVIVQKAHRYGYDHAMFLCGARVTEVVTMDDYKRACDAGNAIMTNFFNAAEEEDGLPGTAQIGREEWLRVAHDHGIPCHIDAAADMPPISNLWKYTGMGFDLVAFSGGKGMRGPQNAGLLLGKKELIDLANQNNNPGDGVGRGMKVAKEQVVGMVAAVDWVLSHTEESMQGDYQKRVDVIVKQVKDIPSVKTETVVPKIANHVPHLLIRFDPAATGTTTKEIVAALRAQTPSIELNPNTGRKPNQGIPSDANTLVVGVWMLQPGEDEIVGKHIRAALTKKA
ncbi:selenocysteine synthase [Granulicella sibirica]|uniref:D-Glucosaminate-6-phosphate ammonia-lyase n=1 Tax=Granulicella sibirica TaxID=2479048 RepID=A0A4Q0SYN7_9BACT|nr:selenocysteine synthase [Granulicella sibirica]RXH55532.1 D-Glucosaminate-6-phosphate ammonia-lyase [Granulicella sibirica]